MEVNSQWDVDPVLQFTYHGGRLGGEGAAVGIAQHHPLGTGGRGRGQNRQCEFGVFSVPVEEMLGVEEHRSSFRAEVFDRFGHHGDALFQRGVESVEHMLIP